MPTINGHSPHLGQGHSSQPVSDGAPGGKGEGGQGGFPPPAPGTWHLHARLESTPQLFGIPLTNPPVHRRHQSIAPGLGPFRASLLVWRLALAELFGLWCEWLADHNLRTGALALFDNLCLGVGNGQPGRVAIARFFGGSCPAHVIICPGSGTKGRRGAARGKAPAVLDRSVKSIGIPKLQRPCHAHACLTREGNEPPPLSCRHRPDPKVLDPSLGIQVVVVVVEVP